MMVSKYQGYIHNNPKYFSCMDAGLLAIFLDIPHGVAYAL